MKVAILYNKVESVSGDGKDLVAEQDILEVVKGVGAILKEMGHEVSEIRYSNDLYSKIRNEKPDIVFNFCDSFEGPSTLEATVPALLEILKIPYTGSGMLALSLCLNKARTKEILTYHNIPNAKFQLFRDIDDELDRNLKFPLIVKPNAEDASIGMKRGCVVNNEAELRERIKDVMGEYKQEVIVEEFIDGREFDVCIIGNNDPQVFPVSETVYKNYGDNEIKVCDYEAKWLTEDKHYNDVDSDFPAKITKEEGEKIKEYAKKAYLVMGCKGYARIEMRLKDDIPYIIEVNPNPDLTVGELFFDLANLVGISKQDLIQKIIDFGLENHADKN